MIVESLMNLIYKFFNLIFTPVNIPGIPEDIAVSMDKFFEYLQTGASFFALVFPINMVPFFVIFLAIVSWDHLYPAVMWVLRKIPFLGIE